MSTNTNSDTKTVNQIDENSEAEQQVMQAIKDTQHGFEEDFTIKVGMTVLEDKLSHTQFSGYKALLTDERSGETVEYVGEHPADAVLGAIEEATDGVY
mgnify:CR=1 FL=1